MKPSAAAILSLLRSRGPDGLSPDEARHWAGCDRLAARVWELRADGHDITRANEAHPGGSHARYVLHERPVQLTLLDSLGSAQPAVSPRGPRQRAPEAAELTAAAPPGAG